MTAVNVEPPVADEVLLVEDGTVGTEERVRGQLAVGPVVVHADMEGLAISLGVRVVTTGSEAVTEERGLGNLGKDGVVIAGGAGDVLGQSLKGILLGHDHDRGHGSSTESL